MPTLSTTTPETIGSIQTSIGTGENPVPTTTIVDPTSTLAPVEPSSIAPSSTDAMPTAQNIFQPVATNAPPSVITIRSDHPVARLGITSQNTPISTNKFYANFFLGNQNAPSWTHPYSVAWSKGGPPSRSWGLSISHIEASQRVFGPDPNANPAEYFINPNGIQYIILSAAELGPSTVLTTDTLTAFSANVNLRQDPSASPAISFPLVQGMGFVTGIYNGSTPIIQTGVFFRTVTQSTVTPKAGVSKYTILLEDSSTWLLYAYSPSGQQLQFTVVDNGLLQATSNFRGTIQIAKVTDGDAEAMYDAACGAYATGVTLSGTANGAVGTYTLNFSKGGLQTATLAMFALVHLVESFSSSTASAMTSVKMQTTTKGIATAVVADSWTMVEPAMPIDMSFAPWSPTSGSRTSFSSSAIAAMQSVATSEISQDMSAQTNLNSFYFAGKVSQIAMRHQSVV